MSVVDDIVSERLFLLLKLTQTRGGNISLQVQPPPELDMPDTCQSGYDSTLILSPDCALLSAELCDQLEEFFFDVIPQLLKIVVDVLEARDILFVSLSCEFVFDLFTWVLDSQCKDDDWEALEVMCSSS